MDFVCPACSAKLRISDDMVPPNGAWARCPKCKDRFFLKPSSSLLALDAADLGPGRTFRKKRSEAEQDLLDRLKKTTPDGQDDSDGQVNWDEIVIYPEAVADYRFYFLAGYVMLALFVLCALAIARYAAMPRYQAVHTPKRAVIVYDESRLRSDLNLLKRSTSRRRNVNRYVDYTGLESRVYKFFLAEMEYPPCLEISSLRLRAAREDNGFTATAVCLDEVRQAPELRVQWINEKARIIMGGVARKEDIDLSRTGQ